MKTNSKTFSTEPIRNGVLRCFLIATAIVFNSCSSLIAQETKLPTGTWIYDGKHEEKIEIYEDHIRKVESAILSRYVSNPRQYDYHYRFRVENDKLICFVKLVSSYTESGDGLSGFGSNFLVTLDLSSGQIIRVLRGR